MQIDDKGEYKKSGLPVIRQSASGIVNKNLGFLI